MVDPGLYSFIRSQLALGKAKEEISAALITKGGWTQADVDEAMGAVIMATTASPQIGQRVHPTQPVQSGAGIFPAPASPVPPLAAITVSPLVSAPGYKSPSPRGATRKVFFSLVFLLIIAGLVYGAYRYFFTAPRFSTTQDVTAQIPLPTPTPAPASAPAVTSASLPPSPPASTVTLNTPPAASASSTQPLSWQTYTNTQLGYQIQYPATFSVQTNASAILLQVPSSYFPNTNLNDVYIAIGATNKFTSCVGGATSPAAAQAFPAWNGKKVTMNSTLFYTNVSEDVAVGQSYNGWGYSTSHGGECYTLGVNTSAYDPSFYPANDPKSQVTAYNPETQLFPIFNQIASTFTFISSSTNQSASQIQ